jgi:protein-S-isoprenylcysteine O-methyltransferase Ste14
VLSFCTGAVTGATATGVSSTGFLLIFCHALLASLFLATLANIELVALVVLLGLLVVVVLLLVVERDFEELELSEVLPVLASAVEMMPINIITMIISELLVSFFITFS